ncbi:hypothetical protein BC629DRAFT_1586831 [Irpex lacteus]|nr:hypothetical protein BC629DRAFT_1586831 [Irpex lacteus]
MSSQRSFASSPHDSSGSAETLADDLHAQECVAPSAHSSTRLAHLNNLDNVPVPWAETTDRLADNRGLVKRKYGRRDHKPSILGEGLSNHVERSRTTYLSDANESHLSSALSPAVTNLTLDLPPSPLPAHRDLDSDVDVSFTSKRRHSRFYLSDTLVTLEIDGCVFQVHRYFLKRESVYLQALLEHDPTAGTSDENAILLTNITVHEFECFLHFLFFGAYDPHLYALEDWLDLLAAATILKCGNIRLRAITELESSTFAETVDAVDRIFIARKYDVGSWLTSAYVDLCVRDGPLREQEIDLLGSKLVSQLCDIRERLMLEAMENHSARQQSGSREGQRHLKKSSRRARQLVEDIIGIHHSPA